MMVRQAPVDCVSAWPTAVPHIGMILDRARIVKAGGRSVVLLSTNRIGGPC